MAVFGVQLILTMTVLSLLYRLSSRYSFARWLLSGRLIRYLHPSDKQIMEMSNLTRATPGKNKEAKDGSSNRQRKKKDGNGDQPSTFKIPRNTNFVLDACRVRAEDLFELKFYPEYQWLLDFGVCTLMVFIFSEIFYYLFLSKSDELNLSLIWCLLAIGFAVRMLFSLTKLYFSSEESMGERSLCITAGGFFFLIAMVVLITDENLLEFGLDPAYASFNQSAYQLLERNGVADKAYGPLSKLLFKFWLAVACGLVGALFMFPGLRFAQMHKDCLQLVDHNRWMLFALNFSFVSPLFVLLLWCRPIGRRLFTERTFGVRGALMSIDTFETSRILAILLLVVVRFILMPNYLQAYLNLAPSRLSRLRKEAGKVSNIEIQRMVASVFYYLCIVTLQYIGPLLLLLYTTLLYKVLGQFSWSGSLFEASTASFDPLGKQMISGDGSSLKSVFKPILFRGLLGFTTWWLTQVWFLTSIIGFVYHTYYA